MAVASNPTLATPVRAMLPVLSSVASSVTGRVMPCRVKFPVTLNLPVPIPASTVVLVKVALSESRHDDAVKRLDSEADTACDVREHERVFVRFARLKHVRERLNFMGSI